MADATGFGSCPFGAGPYGTGTPLSTTGRQGKLLTDVRGRILRGSPAIDPRTRSWKFDANGRRVGTSNQEHELVVALTTVRGTSAWDGGMPEAPERIGASFAQDLEANVREACKHITDAKRIVIRGVRVEVNGPRASATLVWDDLVDGRTNLRTEIPRG